MGGFGAPLGSLGTHLGSFSDRFEVVLGSFGVPFGIFWGSFWDLVGIFLGSFGDHLGVTFSIFRNSVLELKLQLYGPPGGRNLC